jgi:hypothetical protein
MVAAQSAGDEPNVMHNRAHYLAVPGLKLIPPAQQPPVPACYRASAATAAFTCGSLRASTSSPLATPKA